MPPPPIPFIVLPVAPVAPGLTLFNTLAMLGVAMNLHSDYNRDGTTDTADPDYLARVLRPGAILLPNLDISDPKRLPTPAPSDLAPLLDCMDTQINGAADQAQMTVALIEDAKTAAPSTATVAVLRISAQDAERIRVFGIALTPSPVILGNGVPAGQSKTEVVVMNQNMKLFPTLVIEAVTLAGDPGKPDPGGAGPAKPAPFGATLPSGSSGAPVYKKRAPGEVWMELIHQDSAGTGLASPRDVGLFTIAPFLLLSSLQPVRRVFVVDLGINHAFVFDLAEACQAIFGAAVTLPADTSTNFTPSTPASTGPLYIIDGSKYQDEWAQDEMEIGYCWAPHAWVHVVLHCRRNRGLSAFVHAEMPGPRIGLFDALHGPERDMTEFGGNIEVSPPVRDATAAIRKGAAGPDVPAHKPAPFGKILLGDSGVRQADPNLRAFLLAQKVQPVLPLDTSWLSVGHVDEFISFVPSPADKGYKMLFASILAMNLLLQEAVKVPVARGRTNFHRGRWDADFLEYEEISVEELLNDTRKYNNRLRAEKLIPLDRRMKAGLNLGDPDIIRVPVYFRAHPLFVPNFADQDNRTVAMTSGMVNMLVTGNDLIIPKPFAARMLPDDATTVLKRVFAGLGISVPVTLGSTTDQFWIPSNEDIERVVCYFVHPQTAAERKNLIEHIKDSSNALSASNTALVAMKAAEIGAANPSLSALLVPVLTTGTFPDRVRIQVPGDTVDLMESYMLSVFTAEGLTCHFVDAWHYHARDGEAHCATNAIREPPELTGSQRWWDVYDPDYDTRYSP